MDYKNKEKVDELVSVIKSYESTIKVLDGNKFDKLTIIAISSEGERHELQFARQEGVDAQLKLCRSRTAKGIIRIKKELKDL